MRTVRVRNAIHRLVAWLRRLLGALGTILAVLVGVAVVLVVTSILNYILDLALFVPVATLTWADTPFRAVVLLLGAGVATAVIALFVVAQQRRTARKWERELHLEDWNQRWERLTKAEEDASEPLPRHGPEDNTGPTKA